MLQKAFNIYPEKVSWMFADIRLQSKKDDREHDSGGLSPAVKKEEKSLRKLLRLRPNHALARVFLGRCLLKKGSNVEATHHFELAFEQAGENTTVLQRIGEALVRNGYLQQAVGILERVLSINPNSSFALEQLGIVYRKMYFEDKTNNEPLNKALSYFKKAVENDESNFAAKCDIAFIYSLLKKLEEARIMYYDLTQTEDLRDKACAHFNFGKFLEINGESHGDTMEQYRQAMQADRESLFAADAGKRLLNLLKKRLDQDRNDVDALEFMGWLYETTNHTESACFYYEKAYNLKDSESSLQDLVTKLAHLFLQSENVEKAEEFVNKIRKYDQQAHLDMKGRLHCLKGSIHKIGQDMKQARKEFSRAVGLGSFEGLKNLLEILTSCAEEEIFERVWFEDCAKVMRLLRLKFAECDRGSENEEGRQHQALQDEFTRILSRHEKRLHDLCGRFIEMLSYDVDDIAKSKVVDVVLEARNSLDRVMVDFQSHHYPSLNPKKHRCTFFYLQKDEDIEIRLHRKLESHQPEGYQWVRFRGKFPELFDFLVSLQPCKNTDNERLVFLFEITNQHKHRKELSLQEEITIGRHKHQVNLIDLAKWSAITAVNTVRQFTKYMS
ncbi:uncharacterized protein aq_1088-like [Ptychodera flava]|uniref:uncharacterized protein aq_1088-like n=1 Tax=Ptychodera flava TaxID=63121 RepID=UPI003969E81E